MKQPSATVVHGPLVRIAGTFPSVAPGLLTRAGAFLRDNIWWCEPETWPRVETTLRVLGIPLQVFGEAQTAAPAPSKEVQAQHAVLSVSGAGDLAVSGTMPSKLRSTWLGRQLKGVYVGLSPWAVHEFMEAAASEGIKVQALDEAKAVIARVEQHQVAVSMSLIDEKLPDVPMQDESLRDYQRRAIAFGLACNGRFYVGDLPGVGKTPVAIAWKRLKGYKRILVLCPSIAKGNWRDEIGRFDGSPTYILDGQYAGQKQSSKDGWVISGYSTLADTKGGRGWVDTFIGWKPDLVVLDEGHAIKGYGSKVSGAARKLSRSVKDFIIMSGNPMPKGPMDLWSPLDMLQPRMWGVGHDEFGHAFTKPKPAAFGWMYLGKKNVDVLSERLRWVMIRRTHEEAGTQLPEKTRTKMRFPLLPGYRAQFDGVQAEYRQLIEMAEMSDDPHYALDATKGKRAALVMNMRQISSLGRIDATADLVQEFLEEGRKPVVFAYFRQTLYALRDSLQSRGLRVGYIDGSVPRPKRDEVRGEFVHGNLDTLVGQFEAAGVSINLHEASNVTIAHELTYRPIDIEQSEARVSRSGQRFPTQHIYSLGEDTRDGLVLDALFEKMGTAGAILDGVDVEDIVLKRIEAEFFRNTRKRSLLESGKSGRL